MGCCFVVLDSSSVSHRLTLVSRPALLHNRAGHETKLTYQQLYFMHMTVKPFILLAANVRFEQYVGSPHIPGRI